MNQAPSPLETRVIELIAEVCAVPIVEIEPAHRFKEDLGMDSVSSMELLSMLAEEFQLDLPVEQAIGVTTVGGAIAMARESAAGAG